MKPVLLILFFFTACSSATKRYDLTTMDNPATTKTFQYLALGDSYTIGEMVTSSDNFPGQVSTLLNTDSQRIVSRIIARTGWTTDELEAGITNSNILNPVKNNYDFVSLLIGVNNQYRGRPVEDYKPAFERLLLKAIFYAGNRPQRVVVLSIPDWGATPFATGQDRAKIAKEIDAYNQVNKEISARYNIYYIDVTPWTREALTDLTLVTSDGLHPSAKEYRRWAERIAEHFRKYF